MPVAGFLRPRQTSVRARPDQDAMRVKCMVCALGAADPANTSNLTTMLLQAMSLVGALMVLAAYAASQTGKLSRADISYNLLNLVGSTLLGIVAVIDRRLGFILLESAWALLSIPPLLKRPRRSS